MRLIYNSSLILPFGDSHDDGSIDPRYLPEGLKDPNNILDNEASIVALQVLEKFGIPYKNHEDLIWGRIKGYDIRSMNALEAIRVSLAESFKNSEYWEVYVDVDGVARFVNIGRESPWTPPNGAEPISTTINKLDEPVVELVVIRGYDSPPERIVKSDKTIILLDSTEYNNVVITQPIHSVEGDGPFDQDPDVGWVEKGFTRYRNTLRKYASILYEEPDWEIGYKAGIRNSYHPQCFESLIAWKQNIKWSLLEGKDPDASVEFSNTSVISVKGLSVTGVDPDSGGGDNEADLTAVLSLNNVVSNNLILNSSNITLRDFLIRKNIYGEDINTFENVANVLLLGMRVKKHFFANPEGPNYSGWLYYDDALSIFELSEGSEYSWRVGTNDDDIYIDFYYKLSDSLEGTEFANDPPISGPGGGIQYLPIGGGVGYKVMGLWVNLSVNIPSINIFSPRGQALDIAQAMVPDFLKATPVVIKDRPAPVYYRFRADANIPAGLDVANYIAQEQDLEDTDPTTAQPFDDTPSKKLQDADVSRVVDVSFPFVSSGKTIGSVIQDEDGATVCEPESTDDSQIVAVRDYIFDLFNDFRDGGSTLDIDVQTQYIFGANALDQSNYPVLGSPYRNTDAIINGISYSIQDEGSFQLTITTGRRLVNVGSWGTEIYERRTETVSRNGTVLRVAGNGAVYVVKVDGMGTYSAISSTREEIEVGDVVSIQIYNNPSEK